MRKRLDKKAKFDFKIDVTTWETIIIRNLLNISSRKALYEVKAMGLHL